MQKLTREQSEYLIGNIDALHTQYCGKCAINVSHYRDEELKHLIKQCTEKEFPEFEVPYAMLRVLHDHSNAPRSIRLEMGNLSSADAIKWLDESEFKEFTAGCNKIVEYLESQDD